MSRIAPLTSLRFFAAMMVVADHYWGFAPGYAGVGFFYVLSGYVLALNYSTRVGSAEGRKDFWWRRFARIYPTHLLTLILSLPLAGGLVTIPANLALLQAWAPWDGIYLSVNKPSWSISDEAFFYAVFPLLVGIRWRMLGMWAAVFAGAAAAWPGDGHWLFYIFPPARLLEFAIGIALARLGGTTRTWHELAALGLAAASILALPFMPPTFRWALFFVPASALLVYVFARSEGVIASLLGNRWLVLLGDASFMLYMIHWPLMQYFGKSAFVAAVAVFLSVALYLGFEKPVQRRLNRYRRTAAPRSGSSPRLASR